MQTVDLRVTGANNHLLTFDEYNVHVIYFAWLKRILIYKFEICDCNKILGGLI